MSPALLLVLFPTFFQDPQAPPALKPGVLLKGSIPETASQVHTTTLVNNYTDAPVVGLTYRIQVEESGPYHIDFRSYSFDAYLVLRDAEGKLLAEDDDGWVGLQSRILIQLERGREYRVTACALHGERGSFELRLEAGRPSTWTPEERRAEEDADWQKRFSWLEKHEGPESLVVALFLYDRANFLSDHFRYRKAEALFRRALAIWEKVLGPDDAQLTPALSNLASLLQDEGRYGEAEPLFRRVVGIDEKAWGREDTLVVTGLNNLAVLYQDQGRYEQAQSLYERVLGIEEKMVDPEHEETAIVLSSLAALYQQQGRYEEAEPLYQRSLAIREKVLGPEDQDTATVLNNLAKLYEAQGRYQEAEPLYQRAVAIREKVLDPEDPGLASAPKNLGVLYDALGRYEEAGPLLERTVAILEKILGPENPQVAVAYHNLAHHYSVQDRCQEAESLARKALAIWEKIVGPENPRVTLSLNYLAHLLAKQGRQGEAMLLFERALTGVLDWLDRELLVMPEGERFRLLGVSKGPERLLESAVHLDAAPDRTLVDLCLRWKGKATRLQAAEMGLARKKETPDLRRRKGEIQAIGKELSALIFLPLDQWGEDHERRVAALRKERLELEGALNRDLGLEEVLATPASKEVQAALPADAVLLDFYVGAEVFAWVLKHEGSPELVPLGKAETLAQVQAAFLRRTGVRGAAALEAEGPDPGMKYAGLLWKPLAALVGDSGTVLVSPDGFLGELPLEILPDGEGHFLIEKHRFAYLSDATRLVEQDGPAGAREGSVLAVGDVNYYKRQDWEAGQALAMAASHSRSRIGDTWPSLEATREELRGLRDLHGLVLEWKSPFDQLDGKGATEEAVRAALPGHRYLHLATHGYFEPDELPSLMASARKAGPQPLGEERRAVGLLPGLLSGLVFAGVNAKPDPARDDGYLSAEEIQFLDLSACDLAVLSACETALGSKRAGEGLQSLRRSFAVAGAKTVVSSLWKVDDRATATLMRHFYENYWQKGMEKLEALHAAKLQMLRQNRADYQGDARPATWGAFVLSGDWR